MMQSQKKPLRQLRHVTPVVLQPHFSAWLDADGYPRTDAAALSRRPRLEASLPLPKSFWSKGDRGSMGLEESKQDFPEVERKNARVSADTPDR
jgi:hypothetical protein